MVQQAESPTVRPGDSPVPLEAVLCTADLQRRPARPPDYELENRALVALAQALADAPATILQALAEKLLEVFEVGSAGISLLTDDQERFYWPAIAGIWKPHLGGGTPRDFGPCGDVLDRNAPLLFRHPERRYTYLLPVAPPVEECLLVPFYVARKAVGTIWLIAHDGRRRFDAEDLRLLENMGRFASAAYQAVEELQQGQDSRRAALNLMEDAVQSREAVEKLNLELREIERRKDEFMAMLAHELRNPLAPIRNAVYLLKHTAGAEPRVGRAIEAIDRQVGHQARLLDDLLDVSRIRQGKVVLRTERLDLVPLIRDAAEDRRSVLEETGLTLTVALPEAPVWIEGDATRLAQVVGNLLNNAAKFTDRGGDVTVQLTGDEADGRTNDERRTTNDEAGPLVVGCSSFVCSWARLSVRDTGVGIEPEMLAHVFDTFAQADRSLDRSQGGMGLGLALVKGLVEAHDGAVHAASEGVGRGAEFTVLLPVTAPSAARRADVPTAVASVGTRRILIVEDSRDTAETLRDLLEEAGHTVGVAYSGAEAVPLARQFRPEVVLCDLGLPGMNGFEVAATLRRDAITATARLIAVSGYGQAEDRQHSQEAGFDLHLTKPVDPAELERLLGT